MMNEFPDKLLDYNLVDVEGLVLLNENWKMVEDQFEQAWLVMAPSEDGLFTSKLHDHDVIKTFKGKIVFDTKVYDEKEDKKRIPKSGKKRVGKKFLISEEYDNIEELGKKGGFVPPPPGPGIYSNIAVIDFHRYYPNMIMSANAGIRTAIDLKKEYWFTVLDKKGRVWDRKKLIETPVAFFRKDIDSVNRFKFKKWIKRRDLLEKKSEEYLKIVGGNTDDPVYKGMYIKQFRVKNFTNGGFGVFGLPTDRNYSQLSFNATTVSCQDLLKKCIEIIRNIGYDIVGGDTDSIFLQLKTEGIKNMVNEAKEISAVINKEISDYLDKVYNIQDHYMEIDVETISDKFIIKAAKNYVKRNLYVKGVILDKPRLEIKGLSLKKRATSEVASDMQSLLLDILLTSDNIEEDYKKVANLLDKEIENLPWNYIAPRGAINKKIDDYDEGNANARGARNAKKILNRTISEGENPFILPFKKYPSKVNNNFLVKKGSYLVCSFYEEDMEKLIKLGFIPHWDEIRRSQIHLKSKPFFGLIGKKFYEFVAETKVSDDEII